MQEMRGIWVATVENIDWPSKRSLDATAQKAEFIALVNAFEKAGLNAVFVQVRPACDAFYLGGVDPVSHYLTGKQGKDPGYDPLSFMIEACHQRGLEFHAWINPYRAKQRSTDPVAPSHVSARHPDWCFTYGGQTWLNPGKQEVTDYLSSVVADLVQRYALDGVHFDDYFYPYPIAGKPLPDEATWKQSGSILPMADWRRENVNRLIKQVSTTVRAIKPYVKFGISPFGVWRNKSKDLRGSESNAGITNYDDLYADALTWIDSGWVDYIAPQLYWEIGNKRCDYNTLIHWWQQHARKKSVFAGIALYRVGTEKGWAWNWPRQIPRQLEIERTLTSPHGYILYNTSSFIKNRLGVRDSLQKLNSEPAFPWTHFRDEKWKAPMVEPMQMDVTGDLRIQFPQFNPEWRVVRVSTHGTQYMLERIYFPTLDAGRAELVLAVPSQGEQLWITDYCGRKIKVIWSK